MRKYAMEIAQFAGKRSRDCYDVLACAVEVAQSYMPRESQMSEICRETGKLCDKDEKAVYQAICRAAKDIWEYGNIPNLEKAICYSLCVKPSPKELVTSLAQAFWNREMCIRDRVCSGLGGSFYRLSYCVVDCVRRCFPMLEAILLTGLGCWLVLALRSCFRRRGGCGGACDGCCEGCRHCSNQ